MSRLYIDAKTHQEWLVPRRVMCGFFWIGIFMIFTGVVLLVTSKHKGSVYSSWGAVLLGMGFTLLLICLILCLHAYCVITIIEDGPEKTAPPKYYDNRKLGSSYDPRRSPYRQSPRGVRPVQLRVPENKIDQYPPRSSPIFINNGTAQSPPATGTSVQTLPNHNSTRPNNTLPPPPYQTLPSDGTMTKSFLRNSPRSSPGGTLISNRSTLPSEDPDFTDAGVSRSARYSDYDILETPEEMRRQNTSDSERHTGLASAPANSHVETKESGTQAYGQQADICVAIKNKRNEQYSKSERNGEYDMGTLYNNNWTVNPSYSGYSGDPTYQSLTSIESNYRWDSCKNGESTNSRQNRDFKKVHAINVMHENSADQRKKSNKQRSIELNYDQKESEIGYTKPWEEGLNNRCGYTYPENKDSDNVPRSPQVAIVTYGENTLTNQPDTPTKTGFVSAGYIHTPLEVPSMRKDRQRPTPIIVEPDVPLPDWSQYDDKVTELPPSGYTERRNSDSTTAKGKILFMSADDRRLSQPSVAILPQDGSIRLSRISLYDNVQYVYDHDQPP